MRLDASRALGQINSRILHQEHGPLHRYCFVKCISIDSNQRGLRQPLVIVSGNFSEVLNLRATMIEKQVSIMNAFWRASTWSMAIVFLLFIMGGCAAPEKPIVYLAPEAEAKDYKLLVLKPISNDTKAEMSDELLDRTESNLKDKLEENGFIVKAEHQASGDEDFLILNARMLRYEGGDAFGRWIGFGAGAATCSLYVDLIDGRTGQDLGDVASTQSIQAGGLYTIGAENYIVDRCAHSVADGIAEKLRGAESED